MDSPQKFIFDIFHDVCNERELVWINNLTWAISQTSRRAVLYLQNSLDREVDFLSDYITNTLSNK